MHVHDPGPAMTNQGRQGLSGDAWTYTVVFNDKRQFLLVELILDCVVIRVAARGQSALFDPVRQHRILACLRRPRGEVWTSHTARLAFAMSVAFPGLADKVLARSLRRAGET